MTSESTSMVTAAAVAEEINAELAVPFFAVNSMESSVPFYVDVLGFTITKRWIDDGKLRWCWLELGKVAFMLQERSASRPKPAVVGEGVTISIQCRDALAIYHQVKSRGAQYLKATPFVGNGMWVVTLIDPDGFAIEFESYTDVPEGTEYPDADGA